MMLNEVFKCSTDVIAIYMLISAFTINENVTFAARYIV